MPVMKRPLPAEYRPYFQRYIDLVPDGDIVDILATQQDDVVQFFSSLPADRHDYRYAEGKWSIKQVLMHIVDTERVMSYRALVAARGDVTTVLYGMDENLYAENAPYPGRPMQDILEEFSSVRRASVKLFAHLTAEQSTAPAQNQDGTYFTPRALAYIIAGHIPHHINVIKERYL